MDILLIHPPAAKASEPPLGTAILCSSLRSQGLAVDAIDANLEAYLHLLDPEHLETLAGPSPSTALRRAIRHVSRSLGQLRSAAGVASFARYQTAVRHLNTALGVCRGEGGDERLTLGDYSHGGLSEFAPADLERLSKGQATTLFAAYFEDQLLPRVGALAPRHIALSVNYRHQVLPAFELAGMLRRRFPHIPVVGGGGMLTSWKKAILEQGRRFSAFSRLVLGPGEQPLAALAKGTVAQAYALEGEGDVDFVPDYNWASLDDYLSPVPLLQVSASRGCYWRRCQFCPEATAPTHPCATFAPEAVPPLLTELSRRYGVSHFHLTDNAIPPAVLRALAGASEEMQGLRWHGFVRFEKALRDPALVDGLSAAGCAMLQLGLESGSQQVLDRLGKGTCLEAAAKILKNLRRAGIASYVYVMLGTPGETEADAEQTLHFLEQHAADIGFLNIAIMNLPRESGLLREERQGAIKASALWDEAEPLGLYRSFEPAAGWGRAEARRFLKQRLLASPPIKEIVKRTPPIFTSNHAVFFDGWRERRGPGPEGRP